MNIHRQQCFQRFTVFVYFYICMVYLHCHLSRAGTLNCLFMTKHHLLAVTALTHFEICLVSVNSRGANHAKKFDIACHWETLCVLFREILRCFNDLIIFPSVKTQEFSLYTEGRWRCAGFHKEVDNRVGTIFSTVAIVLATVCCVNY